MFLLSSAVITASISIIPSLAATLPNHTYNSSNPVSSPCHNRNVTYQGLSLPSVEGFIGIPFAQDTSNAKRFKPPIPYLPPPNTVVNATSKGPACPQDTRVAKSGFTAVFGAGNTPTSISEDCLRLNVWRPRGVGVGVGEGTGLPVLLFMYGGALTSGYKDAPAYFPGELIRQSVLNGHPIIHVEINYRLGVFGFAQSQALEDEGSENAGVRDQRLAIEWVQQNIQHFGGDPSRITIHGQSSGGLSVGVQTLAYGASKPFPFQQAMFESEVLDIGLTANYTRTSMANVARASKCDQDGLDSASTISCLRGLSMQELLDAQLKHAEDIWLPVVDGTRGFLPEAPSKLMKQGRFAQNDATFFVPSKANNATSVADFMAAYLPPGFSQGNLEHFLRLYPASDFKPSYKPDGSVAFTAEGYRAAQMYRDIIFTCQPLHYAQALAQRGNAVYTYDQNATLLTGLLESVGLYGYGVFHSSEIYYVFGNFTSLNDTLGVGHTPADVALRNQESRSWSSFAAVGRPSIVGKDTLQGWERADFDDANFGTYIIGGPHAGYAGAGGDADAIAALEKEKLRERCAFINSPEVIEELQY